MPTPSSGSALAAEHTRERIVIRRGATALVTQHARPGARPFLHPIAAPDGVGALTEDAPPHHPWQHGLYVGLNDVGGVGFWTEGLAGNPADGTFHPRPLAAPTLAGARADWAVVTDWRAPDGGAVLTETQRWTLHDRGDALELDLAWTLAAAVAIGFGRSAYGGLFLRMPFSEGERARTTVLTSEGRRDCESAEGQRARWVAVAMPIAGRPAGAALAGIAIMDHPTNPEHPAPWRVDGQFGIAPSRCIAGAWSLAAGTATTSRYRVLAHAGASDAAAIEAGWRRFIA